MFKKLDERKTNEVEKSILDTWQKEDILSYIARMHDIEVDVEE